MPGILDPSSFLRSGPSKIAAAAQYAWLRRPDDILFFGSGVGDDLLLTTVAHELKSRGSKRVEIFSKYPELYLHNPDVDGVHNLGYPAVGRLNRWGYRCHVPQYATYNAATDTETYPKIHFMARMCQMAGISGKVALRPYFTLLNDEKARGRMFDRQIVMQSAGLGILKNKDWRVERFQQVADALRGNARVIQLGLADDPPLEGTHDLRGKTTLRESAAILANSLVFVGLVGFQMHLARAVECRSVIVYGGRETPQITGYTANENITGPTPCSPCWQKARCDYGHECMEMIEAGPVVDAVLRQMKRHGEPLAGDVTEI